MTNLIENICNNGGGASYSENLEIKSSILSEPSPIIFLKFHEKVWDQSAKLFTLFAKSSVYKI